MFSVQELADAGIKVKRARGNEVLAHCPFHDDIHPSMSANLAKGVFYCFTCGAKGTFSRLGIGRDKRVYFEDFTRLLNELDNNNQQDDVDYKELVFSLPDEYEPIDASINSIYSDYLLSRGITANVISQFRIGFCRTGTYRDRIIVPMELGFCARSIHSDKLGRLLYKGNFRKYLFPVGLPKSKMLFSFDPLCSQLILVEGVFDVLKLSALHFYSTAILGAIISDEQVSMLCKSQVETIYLCLDGDAAGRSGTDLAYDKLSNYFNKVYKILLPTDTDPGDCNSRELMLQRIEAAKEAHTSYNFHLTEFDSLL